MSKQDVENGEKLWLEAFNSGDAAGVAAQYTEAGRLLPPNSDIVAGRDQLVPFVQGFIDTGAKLKFDVIEIHEAPNVCTAVGRYEMTFDGSDDRDLGKFIEVWVRQGDGSWLIADDIFNSNLPPAAA